MVKWVKEFHAKNEEEITDSIDVVMNEINLNSQGRDQFGQGRDAVLVL